MRKDIELHIESGELGIQPINKVIAYPFNWIKNPIGELRYIYSEVQIPIGIPEAQIRQKGFYCSIPYTPVYKEFKVCIKRMRADGTYLYVNNLVDGSIWFTVQTGLYGADPQNAYASQLILISDDQFYLKIDGGYIQACDAWEYDFNVINAGRQNSNCLLACLPSNNYQYPVSGVGLSRWIGSTNVESTDLADVVQREFADDGVLVINANYNYDTQQLELDLDPIVNE